MLSIILYKASRLKTGKLITVLLLLSFQFFIHPASAQTEVDAIMMNKNQFCAGFNYSHSYWKDYWEGTLKRNNENLGTVTTNALMFMANYGITNSLNVMVGAPYVWTNASAGTLHGLQGVQDISLNVKWKAFKYNSGENKLALLLVGGISTPLNNYVVDFMPLSIGLGSTNFTGRVMVDYVRNRIFATASAAYVVRGNISIDRTSYYDTQMHLTNEVNMPDAANYQLRAGYRGKYLIAEGLLTNWTTLGGYDITRNNMPFPSNNMDATSLGINLKFTLPQHTNLSFLAGANYVIDGRNMGQATSINGGIFYAFYFNKASKKSAANQ
ncbi:hypothetical protein [Flavihumibacter profundi]|jgi:hypothetical protein|uniref:hypothetical protein n=1 Tax=Flavihumibacter profundi TaxID=2716883 RepID=UPI001CC46E3D|nr:hypothetical protein [Flavihumibacter profundi]MBZ5857952.1 hypothetical protein [Flavihumibacter profundi]